MANKDNEPTFRELSDQLDAVLQQLQTDEVDVDEALKLHQQGTKLLEQLEKRLTSAEHQVTTIKTKRS
jgi:exodeoxyribonuclease VII small subunit